MLYGSSQPHISAGLAMFGPQARGVDMHRGAPYGALLPFDGVTPTIERTGTPTNRGLRGLGDWFSDGVNAMTTNFTSVIGAITGSTAQAEAQRNAVALAQLNAQRDMAAQATLMQAIPWVAGGAAVLGLGLILLKKG